MTKPGWTLDDIAWERFDPSKVDQDLLMAVKAASVVEYNARDYVGYLKAVFPGDAAMHAIFEQWGLEETQHGLALGRWVKLADPEFDFEATFKAFREGLTALPPADPDTRAVIDAMAAELGWPAMHESLARLDPATAARLEPTDAQRIQRALEVCYVTGRTLSDLIEDGRETPPPARMIPIALEPSERSVLHERIADRFEEMLELGLISEVRGLRERYPLSPDLPSMRCVGYRQTWQYLDGEFGLARLRETGIAATRQLAKRQLTWLRSTEGLTRFDCLDPDLDDLVCDHVAGELRK